MRAMILAAGRGERMGKLTEQTPKPLLLVSGRYLIEYPLLLLKEAGIKDIVINISYYGDQIKAALGRGERYGVNIIYSEEKERLETGGGIFHALPLLGEDPFLVISSDIITSYPLTTLLSKTHANLAHLVMVNNPSYNPKGDFSIEDGMISIGETQTFTYANLGIYHPALFDGCQPGHFRLAKLLMPAIQNKQVSGEFFQGTWHNVGTPDDLLAINQL